MPPGPSGLPMSSPSHPRSRTEKLAHVTRLSSLEEWLNRFRDCHAFATILRTGRVTSRLPGALRPRPTGRSGRSCHRSVSGEGSERR